MIFSSGLGCFMKPLVICVCFVSLLAAAKDHPQKVTIHVTRSSINQRGLQAGSSTTSSDDGSTSSSTRYYHFTPWTAIDLDVIMPDGTRADLWCKRQLRNCVALNPGDYQAEIKPSYFNSEENAVWIYVKLPVENSEYNSDGSLMPRKMRLEKIMYHVAAARQRVDGQ